jgi:CheY-like chemotaxis protein
MAVFGFGKDKKEAGGNLEQILAYLEDAQRTRTVFTLSAPRKPGIGATLLSIDEGQGRLTFQVQQLLMGADKGGRLDFVYIQEPLRLGGTLRLVEARPGVVVTELPASLEIQERRAQPRARLNAKEGCTLTALTGLFEGVGITGIVENLSEGGARIRVEKAMNLKGEKRLPLGTALVPVGQPFMLIKVNKAPRCPVVMELEGRAVYLENGPSGLVLGLAFSSPRADQASALRGLVSSRTASVPTSLPAKSRRRPDPPAASSEPAPAPVPQPPPPAQVGPRAEAQAPLRSAASAPAPAEAAPAPQVPPPPQAPPEPVEPPAPRNEALVRLKKRSRAVVALAHSPADGDILKDYLHEEGFGRVLVTHQPKELAEFLQQPNLAVLLVDGDFGPLDALAFIGQLRSVQPDMPPVILAVEAVSTGIVLAAHRQGVTQMLVKPYALDAAFCDLLIQQL